MLAILKQTSEISREEIAERTSKTVRTVQRALVYLPEKGYIRRVGTKKKYNRNKAVGFLNCMLAVGVVVKKD